MIRKMLTAATLGVLASTALSGPATAQSITIALQDDPDVLDPHRGNSFVGRVVFASMCDKLVEIDASLNIVPQIATEWSWSEGNTVLTMALRDDALFHDGTPVNAEAVKANIDRAINLPESRRRAELASVDSVEALDEHTVVIRLSSPDAGLLAQLTDRAGMLISPASFADESTGGSVCSGPYSFVRRVQNDRIVLERFAEHWDAENYHFETVTFRPIPDSTVRLANLQAGDIDIAEQPAPTDAERIQSDPNLSFETVPSLGWYGIAFNINGGERAENPINADPRVRQAFDLSIDREVINQVIGLGTFLPAYQPFAPSSFAYNPAFDGGGRDIAAARALMAEAGHDRVAFEIVYANNTRMQQMFELVQAMATEGGFDITLRPTEFAAYLEEFAQGNFDAAQINATGRLDPDGNLYRYLGCEGAANFGRYCDPTVEEALLNARQVPGDDERRVFYDQAQEIMQADNPIIYLIYPSSAWALNGKLQDFTPYPDGIIRLRGVSLSD